MWKWLEEKRTCEKRTDGYPMTHPGNVRKGSGFLLTLRGGAWGTDPSRELRISSSKIPAKL